jgi:Rps23 Pro-64 3,4-dihydroxylase Tpa1-like proline 4-hydroxylase|tara:strand:+ start:78 stop:656 length:579 start_codon:yes stop_codon:yes gene_type:complete
MDFVYEIPNNLSDEKCEEIIKRFDADERKTPGVAGNPGTVTSVKRSMDLSISNLLKGWEDIDEYLHTQLGEGIKKYCEHGKKIGCQNIARLPFGTEDTGYQIQKSEIGDFYSWHDDQSPGRSVTFLWYLTTHDPIAHGGGTAFHPLAGDGGKIVVPERGKLILFPATWTYIHMGLPLFRGDPKYICTGWLHF